MLNDMPLFSLWFDFTDWMLEHTEKFPKHIRVSFSVRLENLTLDIMQDIIQARYSHKKVYLENINSNLNILRVLVRLSFKRKYLNMNSYQFASNKINEAGRMVGGWLKYNNEESNEDLFESL